MKNIYTLILSLLLFVACDRKELNLLYKQGAENEILVKQLEKTVFDMNEQISTLYNLTQALIQRHHLTNREKTEDGYRLTFNDTTHINLHHGRTPIVEIIGSNWYINGKDTGVQAKGIDGSSPHNPEIRINPDTYCWELSADGINWHSTGIRAKGETGDKGKVPSISINADGNWTIDGTETTPPIGAIATDGTDGLPPHIGIDSTQYPAVWKISTDGGLTWTATGIKAEASKGESGNPGTNYTGQYIQNISVIGDSIIFTFNVDIPGIVPATRVQKVALNKPAFTITATSTESIDVNGRYWLLFGVSQTRKITYTVSGSEAVSVDVTALPQGLQASVNETTHEVTITSDDESGTPIDSYGSITLIALDLSGRTASCGINITFVHTYIEADFKECYIYEIVTPGNNRVAYLYTEYHGIPSQRKRYFYAQSFTNNCPAGITIPYTCTLHPVIATDIDGNRYKVSIHLGKRQLWFSENLKTTHYNDGTAIPNLTDATAWATDTKGAYRYYEDNPVAKDLYGALYNGHAVASGKLAPIGWRIPSDEEWKEMEKDRGMSDADNNGWRNANALGRLLKSPEWDGAGTYLYMALPGGYCTNDGTQFLEVGTDGYWWCYTQTPGSYYRKMETNQVGIYRDADKDMNTGMSVRCIKDL